MLSQVYDGQERVIAYYNKTLNKAERNYCVTRWELLSIVRKLDNLNKYPYGQEFHLRTEHYIEETTVSAQNEKTSLIADPRTKATGSTARCEEQNTGVPLGIHR